MKLTKDQVKHVAKLANLPLTAEEEKRYSEQLSKILDYVEQLNRVETSSAEPTFNVTGQSNVMREDETTPSLSQEEALSNAPQKKECMFETKGVFED
ncbi:MAG: Asp-tRNA(Asn)/Glu-tRNA(Gln) amidotransferase subunit GatC [Candidatus Daviesbacteria bacterium]|nr:Asp-tRNA(Asn)/Glu-tRNA(Gln) amidotransferase subunit GatC [Candidatus Daviesbacteria bacterium]